MTIECPNCQARYEVNLPPEGRTVRCARCKTVWRAMPIEETEEAQVHAGQANGERHQPADRDTEAQTQNPQSPLNGSASDFSSSEDKSNVSEEDRTEIANEVRTTAEMRTADEAEAVTAVVAQIRAAESPFEAQSSGRSDKTDPAPARLRDSQSAVYSFRSPYAATNNDFDLAAPTNELQTLEEARAAVRDVFSSLNDSARPLNGSPYVEPVLAQSGEPVPWRSRFSVSSSGNEYEGRMEGGEQHSGSESIGLTHEGATHDNTVAGTFHGEESTSDSMEASEEPEDETYEGYDSLDGDALPSSEPLQDQGEVTATVRTGQSLSGDEADAAIRAALTRHYARDNLEPVQSQDFNLAQQLEVQLKSAPLRRDDTVDERRVSELYNRPGLPLESLAADTLDREDRDDASDVDVEARVDQGLLQQLERTKAQEVGRPQHGGLLLAAAWGLFLSIAAGLVGGAFAFRDMAAEALPGLAPVYRSLGMPITVQPLSFDSVKYEWSPTTVRPTLVISGTVVNKASRKVKTPDFYLTVRDQDPQLDREYSIPLPVEGGKIRAKQQADFQIELVSPNPSITAVELELRNVQ